MIGGASFVEVFRELREQFKARAQGVSAVGPWMNQAGRLWLDEGVLPAVVLPRRP